MSKLWLLASIGPALLLIGYGVFKARGSWTSLALWLGFAGGAGAAVLAVGLEGVLMNVLGLMHDATASATPAGAALKGFVVAGFTEEALKLAALLLVVAVILEGRRLQDVLLVAVGVAMGFAGLENMIYLMNAGSHWQALALLRAGSAVPIHGTCGLLMGAVLIGVIANDVNRAFGLLVVLAVPVALHGTYDTLLMLQGRGVDVWRMPATVVVMLGGGLLAVALCNSALIAATEVDGWEPEQSSPFAGVVRWLVKRATRYYVGLLFIPVALGGFKPEMMWGAAFLAVLPVVLALDVLFTRRRFRPALA